MDPVNPETFWCIERGAYDELLKFRPEDLRPFLPLLVRSSFIPPVSGWVPNFRENILVALTNIEAVNDIITLLTIEFVNLEVDVKKEIQLRQKIGNREQDSILIQSLPNGIALEFERSEATRKFRVVLSEILFIISQMHETRQDYYIKQSDLFDSPIYLEEVCDTISIALVELPNLLSICDICEAFLHLKYGPWIICRLVANLPDTFTEVCFHLISNGDKCDEDSEGGLIRLQTLKMLCKMNPRHILLIRSKCIENGKMPGLAILLSLENGDVENDLIPFLSGVLLGTVGNDQTVKSMFTSYIRNGQKKKLDTTSSLSKMRVALWGYIQSLVSTSVNGCLPDKYIIRASSVLRLACALKGTAGFKFNEEEIISLVDLITLKAPNTAPGYRFATLGICTLLTCPAIIGTVELEKKIIEWIKSLITEEAGISSSVDSSFGEILLLIAIHFHSNQLSAIADLVCMTLGIKVTIRLNTMNKTKMLFTQEIFTEKVVTSHAVKVPVTVNLCADLSGFLPVHCIYQLIKSRAFTKYKVPIKDWIYSQVLTSKFPIHSVLPTLLEVYTQSILVPGHGVIGGSKSLEHTNEPFTDEEVLRVFKTFQNKSLAPQLLILYYVLLYEENRLANCRNLISLGKKVKTYSGKLFSQIPIKFLLQEAQKNQNNCNGLYPLILKLLTTQFPQLCIVNEWLEESALSAEENSNFHKIKCNFEVEIPPGSFQKAFEYCEERPVEAIRLLEACRTLSPHKLWEHSKEIVGQIKVVVRPSVPRKIQDLFRDVWYLLNNVFPRHLWEMTSNALLPEGSLHLSVEELTVDPTQILRCDTKVFRCAPVLNILLHILAASLAASKYFLSKHLQENPSLAPNINLDNEREELKMALINVQDSVSVQILLEACLPTEEEKKEQGIGKDLCIKEIQSLICSYIHQIFINDITMAKLVHFQGYPLDLLPVTVKGIPSMHICLDFIPELLAQPEMEKQIFAIQLTSYISMQYALPKSMAVAKLAVNALGNMVSGVVSEERAEFFISSLSALERLCVAFPTMMNEAIEILMHLGKVCTAQNAVERNRMSKVVRNKLLLTRVHETYDAILHQAMLKRKII